MLPAFSGRRGAVPLALGAVLRVLVSPPAVAPLVDPGTVAPASTLTVTDGVWESAGAHLEFHHRWFVAGRPDPVSLERTSTPTADDVGRRIVGEVAAVHHRRGLSRPDAARDLRGLDPHRCTRALSLVRGPAADRRRCRAPAAADEVGSGTTSPGARRGDHAGGVGRHRVDSAH